MTTSILYREKGNEKGKEDGNEKGKEDGNEKGKEDGKLWLSDSYLYVKMRNTKLKKLGEMVSLKL